MKTERILAAASLLALTAACSSSPWKNAEALQAETVEAQLDGDGMLVEVEYHTAPSNVPASIHAAMNELYPDGNATAAEKEFVGGELFWELTKNMNGKKIEAMFHADGRLHSEEIEVDTNTVPRAVQDAARGFAPGATARWEIIRDSARELVEYHAKLTKGGKKYKLLVGLDGKLLRVVREINAEIEVPLD